MVGSCDALADLARSYLDDDVALTPAGPDREIRANTLVVRGSDDAVTPGPFPVWAVALRP